MCQRRAKPRKTTDCNGTCRGTPGYGAVLSCGACIGGKTGLSINHGKDKCGKCGGDDNSCKDCNGTINGNRTFDTCNKCRHPNDKQFNACVKLTMADPTSASATSGAMILVKATGLKSFNVAKCWFEDKNQRLGQLNECACALIVHM